PFHRDARAQRRRKTRVNALLLRASRDEGRTSVPTHYRTRSMSLIEVVLSGVILGGLYALIAIGFNLQYGVARIFNLAYGEFLMAAAFAAFWMFTLASIDPILGMALSVPVTFGANWLVYKVLMLPLVRRARTRDDLEGDTILATFGLLFVLKGAA